MRILIGKREYKLGRMIMSHMVSDNIEDLHSMARLIGVDRKHFQAKKNKPHYDICKKMKERAIMFGAQLVDEREIINLLKSFCNKCNGNGWYFVDEWIGTLQGRKDCDCKQETPKQ